MMKKSKFFIKLLSVCFFVSVFLCLVSCGNSGVNSGENNSEDNGGGGNNSGETLSVLNWQDETEQVVLGACYDVVVPIAKDDKGNEYPVNVKVIKNENGAVIPLIYDAFDILSIGGYKIKYIASDGTRSATKTVSLTVVDESKPVIILTGSNVAEMGVKYYYPTINASDNSGEKCAVTVIVTDSEGKTVTSTSDGFTPQKVGLYMLSITAKDSFGNEGNAQFEVFARETVKEGEIDSFDDGGLEYGAYTLLKGEKTYAEFTAFKHNSISKGSAMFASTKGETTNIYITPRINAVEVNALGDNNVFSVSMYISDNYKSERTVNFGTGSIIVPTNVWTYVDISKDEVGNLGRFSTSMIKGEKPLLTVDNGGGNAYLVFIDDVYVNNIPNGTILSGIKNSYSSGEQLNFTVKDGYIAELWSSGRVSAVTSGTVPDHDGTYTLICRSSSGIDARVAKSFKVGSRTVKTSLDKTFSINYDNALPTVNVYNGSSPVSAAVSYYDLGLYTGNITSLTSSVHPNKVDFALITESEVSGRKVSDIVFLKSKYTSDPFGYMGNNNGSWMPMMEDAGRQADAEITDSYTNIETIGNFCWHIESYGEAPWVKFASLKEYMYENCINSVTIKILVSDTSRLSYNFGEKRASHTGIKYKTGEVLTFENITADDISHVQVIWGTADIYVMVQLPNHRRVTPETVVGYGEVTLKDNSAAVFADCANLKCTVIYPDNTSEEITGGKFTQKQKGTYIIRYSAKSSEGEEVVASYRMQIGLSLIENASIWDFSDSAIIRNDPKEDGKETYYVEHLEEFDGEEGVVAVTSKIDGYNWDIWFLSGYTGFATGINGEADTLYLRIKASKQTNITLFGGGTIDGDSVILYEYPISTEWTTIEITGDAFSRFKNYLPYYRGAICAYTLGKVTFYISELYVAKCVSVTAQVTAGTGEITLADDSGTVFKDNVKLECKVKTPSGVVADVADGKFTADEEGVYTVLYSALMPSGLVKTASYSIISTKSAKKSASIWDFSDPTIIRNDVKESDNDSYYVEYLDSCDGEEGVVAVTSRLNDYNWDIWFLSGYTGFATGISGDADTLYVRMKASDSCSLTLFGGGADAGASLIMYEYQPATVWTTVEITGEKFEQFKAYFANYRGAIRAWTNKAVTIYISDIYVGKSVELTNNLPIAVGEITLDDDSETAFSGHLKLDCEVKAPDNTVVEVTSGKFTAEKQGEYTVTYYALMPLGVVKIASYKILNTNSIKKSASIWDFDDSSIVANDVKESDNASYYVDYLDSYDGEEGVVAVTNKLSDWNWDIWFLSGYTCFAESINDNADTLYIRLKSTAACKITLFGGGTSSNVGDTLVLYEYTLPTSWTTIAITGDNFNHFKNYLAHYRGAFQAWMSSSATLYISDIYVGKSVTVTNNNSALIFGEVTIDDDSESVFVGYDKLDCEVKAPNNSSVTVTNGKFTPTVNGVYTVTYYALMPSGVVKVGSYSITCLIKNDLGTFVPSASDWIQQGGTTYTVSVIDSYAEHVTNTDTAAYTNFSSVRNYMTANSLDTVKVRFDFISGGKISIGKISGAVTSFEFGDTDGSGRYFAAGDSYELTFNLSDYDRVYCQIIWTACEFVITYEFIA